MKKVSVAKLTRWPLAAGLMCALSCLATRPAQAEWRFTYEVTGTATRTGMVGDKVQEETGDCGTDFAPDDCMVSSAQPSFAAAFPNGTTITASSNPTYAVKAIWIGDPETPAPKKLWFKVTGYTHVYGSETSSFGMDSQLGTSSPYGSQYGRAASTIITKKGGSSEYDLGSYTFSPKGTTVISADLSDPAAGASAGVFAEAVDCSLLIWRGIPLKRKGDPGVTIDEDKDEWMDENGDGHGNSRYSYTERVDLSGDTFSNTAFTDNPVILGQAFGAVAGSGWSNGSIGTWSNPNDYDRKPPEHPNASHVEDLPDGGGLLNSAGLEQGFFLHNSVAPGWYNTTSSGGQITVTYDLTDPNQGSSPKETATYTLKLHHEWENPTADDPAQTHATWQMRFPVSRIVGPQKGKSWKIEYTGKLSANLSANFGGNFKLHDWLTAGGDFKAEADLGVAASYEASAPPIDLDEGESAIPCISYIVKTDHKLLDHFELSGWDKNAARADSKWPQSADLPVNINDTYADWYRVPTGRPAE